MRALPEDRPSAGEIADELNKALESLPGEYGDREKFYMSIGRDSDGRIIKEEDDAGSESGDQMAVPTYR